MPREVTKARVIENSAAVLMARVTKVDGTYIQQSDISAMTIKSFLKSDGTLVKTASLDPTQVVFNTLQTDGRWSYDDTGYNVAVVLDGDYWPEGDTYQVELKVTPTSADAFYVLWEVAAYNIFSE